MVIRGECSSNEMPTIRSVYSSSCFREFKKLDSHSVKRRVRVLVLPLHWYDDFLNSQLKSQSFAKKRTSAKCSVIPWSDGKFQELSLYSTLQLEDLQIN